MTIHKIIVALLIVVMSYFVFGGVPKVHAQPAVITGWCQDLGCSNGYQDGGQKNCSYFQYVRSTQDFKDDHGRSFATGYMFESQNNTLGYPCQAYWGAMHLNSGVTLLNAVYLTIGTLNTKLYYGYEQTPNNWYSTKMAGDSEKQGTNGDCKSAWYTTTDSINNVAANVNIKMISGGANC